MYWKMQFLYKIFWQNKMLCRPSFFRAETWNTHIIFFWPYGTFHPPWPHSSNAYAQPSSGARCLIFGRTLDLLPFFLCVRTAKALTRQRGRAGSPEPSLVAYVINAIIPWAAQFVILNWSMWLWKTMFLLQVLKHRNGDTNINQKKQFSKLKNAPEQWKRTNEYLTSHKDTQHPTL